MRTVHRLRVKAMGGTMAEQEQAVVSCLPKLGPKGEQERLPRVDLTRLLQQLQVGVRFAFPVCCGPRESARPPFVLVDVVGFFVFPLLLFVQ